MVPLQWLGEQDWVTGSGQAALLPGQLAASVATSLLQLAARHCTLFGLNPSAGQLLFAPSQNSAWSHAPTTDRHWKLLCFLTSAGQLTDAPVHFSSASQTPTAARQTTPEFPAACMHAGVVVLPLHRSVVQTLLSSEHGVLAGLTTLVGQVEAVPVHFSSLSHSLAAALHTIPALPEACTHVAELPLHRSVVQIKPSSAQAVPAG